MNAIFSFNGFYKISSFKQIKKGNLKKKQKPDRAIFWKKARMPKDATQKIDEEHAKIFSVIVSFFFFARIYALNNAKNLIFFFYILIG